MNERDTTLFVDQFDKPCLLKLVINGLAITDER